MNNKLLYRFLSLVLCAALLLGSLPWINAVDPALAAEIPTAEAAVSADGFAVHFIDVGQADAALVLCDGEAMLIDGGNTADSNLIYTYLRDRGITHLEYMVATHAHEDHVGGLAGALSYATVDTVFSPTTTFSTTAFKNFVKAVTNRGKSITIPTVGQTFKLGRAVCTVLAVNTESSDINNTSIVLRVVFGETSFLFTGDAEQIVEQTMIEQGQPLSSTVLKVGHHGSNSSTSYSFLWYVMPQYAVISCGQNNEYGHPHDGPLSRLRDAGTRLFRTDMQGDIVCTSDGSKVSFSVSRNANADVYAEVGGSNPEVTEPETTQPDVSRWEPATSVEVGKPYILGMNTAGTERYFYGKTESSSVYYRMASTTDVDATVPVYLEAVSGVAGGYRLYFIKNGFKYYIRTYEYTDGASGKGKGSMELTTTVPAEYYTFDTSAYTLVYKADRDNSYYIGTYNSYTTFSVSNTYYISGNRAENIGVSQFPARLYTAVNMVDQWNVSLEEDLKVSFHLNMAETDQVKISVDGSESILQASQLEKTESGAYVASIRLPAAQMTERINLQCIGSTGASSVHSYSVREYADRILADESYSRYHALVKEMLNYGGYAQIYFDHKVADLANAGISNVAVKAIPETAETEIAFTGKADNITFFGASLYYRDKVAVRFYFQTAADIGSYVFTAGGKTCKTVQRGQSYYVEIPDILPEELNKPIMLTVTDGTGKALTVTYSPMNYIVRMNVKGSDELKGLLKALYNYHLAAKALRGAA